MFFTSHFTAAAPKASRTRAEGRSPRRRRAPISLETLEVRDLKSGIPGISFAYGTISIQGTDYDRNSAHVSLVGDNVRVTLNDQVVEYNASEVYGVTYVGGASGSDTFVNNTNLNSLMYGYGGNNRFSGGSSFNTVFISGDFNHYDARGGASYVFAFDGPNNDIVQYNNNYVYSYNTTNFFTFI